MQDKRQDTRKNSCQNWHRLRSDCKSIEGVMIHFGHKWCGLSKYIAASHVLH